MGHFFRITHDLLNKGISVKGSWVYNLSVCDSIALQSCPDCVRIYIVKEIVFRFCLQIGVVYLLETGYGRIQILHKVCGDGFSIFVPVKHNADGYAAAVTIQNLFDKFITIQELPGVGNFAIVVQIVNPACHGHRRHIHGGQFFQVQMSQFLRQHGFQIGELFFLDHNTIHLGDDGGVFQVRKDCNAVQIIIGQSGSNRNKITVFLQGVFHTVFLLYKVTDESLGLGNFMDEVGGCHDQSASIKISFKILSAHTDGFLVGKFKGEGVPHIIRVNALNDSNDTANLIVTGNKCGSFAVF